MLMAAEVVDDPPALRAVDHVSVEPPPPARLESTNPRDSFASEGIAIRIVLDRERNVRSVLGKHDPAERPDVQEWQRVQRTVPEPLHDAAADGRDGVGAAESEPALNLRMETREVAAERLLVDRPHGFVN